MARWFKGTIRKNLKKEDITKIKGIQKKLEKNKRYPFKVVGIDPATKHIGIAYAEVIGKNNYKILGTEQIEIKGNQTLKRIYELYKIIYGKILDYDYMIIEDQYFKRNLKTYAALLMSKTVCIIQWLNQNKLIEHMIFLNAKEHRLINFNKGSISKKEAKKKIVKGENLSKKMTLDESDALSIVLAGIKIIEGNFHDANKDKKTQNRKNIPLQ